ncbi:DUF4190 and DUF4352 domain-containing protein [Blastococcus sp. TML/M2B]|uniref:DUF4190 domain-containing protein n=1 Tax=unclassified Blastococcus TaxID=2619396 RepID=UPI00190A8949|nr:MULTISPECIES: DUF4190 domain-containing protein [unclassified Blastococcus]MBN1091893.1 DUF4190 and DUF4352 domain-containing protein [Blastococcus sp. TML/M2B]MBN1098001.1 DUF4190 and DUF4352 domain-containing protein [Blastococcus sp. TML/C7B]
MSQPPQAPYQSYAPPPYAPTKKGAGLAIASMVLGIIALIFSWIPIINNLAAVLALVGLGLGIPALLRARKGTHHGFGFAVAGLVTSVLAFAIVLATQAFYSEVLDDVAEDLDRQTSTSSIGESPAEETSQQEDEAVDEVVPLGTPAQIGDYEVVVDSVQLDANDIVAGANQFNDAPEGQYVLAQLTVTYTGADEGQPGFDLTAIFHGSDSRQYSDSECSAVTPDDSMDAPTLNPGGSDTFEFCMDVAPAGLVGGQLSIEPTFSWDSDERVFFAIE